MILGNKKIYYYKIEKNKIKDLNNEPDKKNLKTKNAFIYDYQFQKNEMLFQKFFRNKNRSTI